MNAPNVEIKHDTNVVSALLLEQNDKRVILRYSMALETLTEVGDNSSIILSAVAI